MSTGYNLVLRCRPTGGQQAVAEAYRNLSATGATPLAITNNLNGSEKPGLWGSWSLACVAWARRLRRSAAGNIRQCQPLQ